MIKITFTDNSVKEFESGITPLQIAESISPRLAQEVLAATVDGQEWDLSRSINADAAVKLFKWDDPEGKHAFWHSSAHVLAQAILRFYPEAKLTIGPAIENGFYYDFDFKTPITQDDFDKIEAEMHKIIKANLPITRFVLPRKDALDFLMANDVETH